MAGVYGSQWTSWRGNLDDGLWLVGLDEFTRDEIAEAIEMIVLATDDEFAEPPNLPRFRSLCRRVQKRRRERVEAETPRPDKPVDRKLARIWLDKCRQAIRGNTKSQG